MKFFSIATISMLVMLLIVPGVQAVAQPPVASKKSVVQKIPLKAMHFSLVKRTRIRLPK